MAEPTPSGGLFNSKEEAEAYSRGAADARATAAAGGQSDPVTTKLLNQNSLQLGLVASSINNLNQQVVTLNNSLRVISSNLATSQALERRKEESEQAQERKLAQEQLRQGQESIIEKKIENAAVEPARKLATKAQFTLGNLGGFFLTLIGGWLTTQAIDAINAQAEGNTEKLNEIKLNVLKGLGVIVGVFVASNGALRILSVTFGRIGILLAGLAAVGLFTKPGRDFLTIIKNTAIEFYNDYIKNIPLIGNELPEIPNPEPEPEPEPLDPAKPPSGQPKPPGASPPLDPAKPPGAQGYNEGGLVNGKEGIDQILAWLSNKEYVMPANIVEQRGVEFFDSLRKGESIFSTENKNISSPASQPKVQPMQDLSGKKIDPESEKEPGHKGEIQLGAAPGSETADVKPAEVPLEGDPSRGLSPGQINPGDKTLLEMGFTVGEVKSFIDTENYIGKFGKLPSNIVPVEKTNNIAKKVSQPPPEQPINIIPIAIPSGQGGQTSPPKSVTGSTGSVGNVPSFSTSDSSNIYRLNTITMFNVLPG